jgi:hypothetical protein
MSPPCQPFIQVNQDSIVRAAFYHRKEKNSIVYCVLCQQLTLFFLSAGGSPSAFTVAGCNKMHQDHHAIAYPIHNFPKFTGFPSIFGRFPNFSFKTRRKFQGIRRINADPEVSISVGQCSYPTNVRNFWTSRRFEGVEAPEGHEQAPAIFAVNFQKIEIFPQQMCVAGVIFLSGKYDTNFPKFKWNFAINLQ